MEACWRDKRTHKVGSLSPPRTDGTLLQLPRHSAYDWSSGMSSHMHAFTGATSEFRMVKLV